MAKQKSIADCHRSFAAAERALLKARDRLRAATKREGLSTANLFGESTFVPREYCDRRAFLAENKGMRAGRAEIIAVLEVYKNPGLSPFAHLAASPVQQETRPPAEALSKPTLVVDNSIAETGQLPEAS